MDNVTDFDRILQAQYDFINNTDKKKSVSVFSGAELDKLTIIKTDEAKRKNFKKWYKMSYTQSQIKSLHTIDHTSISKSIAKYMTSMNNLANSNLSACPTTVNTISKRGTFDSDISTEPVSQSEIGLREFYFNNKKDFKSRVIKGPPDFFRIRAWMIVSEVELDRPNWAYYDLIQNQLDEETQYLINKDITRSLQKDSFMNNNIIMIESLSRILKAIALVDKELSYCQGMNFICGFLLKVASGNEVDVFYLVIALFSQTFSNRFGLRGFYTDNFPMLDFYMHVFEVYFHKKMKKIAAVFENVDMPQECWISKWFQTLFVHILPERMLIRIWDLIFAKGLKSIISIALSILSLLENKIKKATELDELSAIFKHYLNEGNIDIEKVIALAEEKYHIKKSEMIAFEEEYIKNGGNLGKNKKYEYRNVVINLSLDDIVSKLRPCKKFTVKEEDGDEIPDEEMDCKHSEHYRINSMTSVQFNNPFH